jgi:hypothetical protein
MMLGHNHEAWTMPDDMVEYVALWNEADQAARMFRVAITDLYNSVGYCMHEPQALLAQGSRWPTQTELRDLYQAMQAKIGVVQSKHRALAKEHREHVKAPAAIGR